MVAILITDGKVTEKDMVLIRWAKAARAGAQEGRAVPLARRSAAVLAASAMLFARLGQEFVPTLDEKDVAMHAMRIPSTGITQSQAMQFDVERCPVGP